MRTRTTDTGLAALSELKGFTKLNLDYTTVTDKGVAALAALPNLSELRLDSATITDSGIDTLKTLARLEGTESLPHARHGRRLSEAKERTSHLQHHLGPRVSTADQEGKLMRALIAALAVCSATAADLPAWIADQGGRVDTDNQSRVIAVRLPFGWVTDADLEPIAGLATLKTLDLSLSLVTDSGIGSLKNLENVEDLNLTSVEHITDVAISYLRGWKKLLKLSLRGTDITDTSLQYLGGVTSLRSLDISYTQVTNNGMEYLSRPP